MWFTNRKRRKKSDQDQIKILVKPHSIDGSNAHICIKMIVQMKPTKAKYWYIYRIGQNVSLIHRNTHNIQKWLIFGIFFSFLKSQCQSFKLSQYPNRRRTFNTFCRRFKRINMNESGKRMRRVRSIVYTWKIISLSFCLN